MSADTGGDFIVDAQLDRLSGWTRRHYQRRQLRASIQHAECLGQTREALAQERLGHLFKNRLVFGEILARHLRSALEIGGNDGETVEGERLAGVRLLPPIVVDPPRFLPAKIPV